MDWWAYVQWSEKCDSKATLGVIVSASLFVISMAFILIGCRVNHVHLITSGMHVHVTSHTLNPASDVRGGLYVISGERPLFVIGVATSRGVLPITLVTGIIKGRHTTSVRDLG